MSVAPLNSVPLSDALMLAEVAEGPLLCPLHGWLCRCSTELICHRVIPKPSRMHQEWPEFGGLHCALLWQATGCIYVNSQEIKKQFLPGILVIREVNELPRERSCYCLSSTSIYLVVEAGKSPYADSYCGAATIICFTLACAICL